MSLRDEIGIHLTDRGILRSTLAIPIVLGLALIAMWPRGSLETALRPPGLSPMSSRSRRPVSFSPSCTSAHGGARMTSPPIPGVQLREYAALTPVPVISLVGGRLASGALHTLLILLLGAPFLVAAMAVGGADVRQTLRALAVIGAAGLAARMCGLLALALLGARRPLRRGLLFVVLVGALAVTFLLAQDVSPPRALASLLEPGDGSASWIACAAASLGAAVLLAVPVRWRRSSGVRARASRRAPRGGRCSGVYHAEFRARVARLRRSAPGPGRCAVRQDGLFFGLLPGTRDCRGRPNRRAPFPALCAAAAAAIGLAAGALSALFAPLGRRRMLMEADAVLGSRELASTALELELFQRAPVSVCRGDHRRCREAPRRDHAARHPGKAAASLRSLCRAGCASRGRGPALPHRPALALAAAVTGGGDARPDRRGPSQEGPDARRGLALPGPRPIPGAFGAARPTRQRPCRAADPAPEDALDRMSDIESGLAQEYQLRGQRVQSDAPQAGPGTGDRPIRRVRG